MCCTEYCTLGLSQMLWRIPEAEIGPKNKLFQITWWGHTKFYQVSSYWVTLMEGHWRGTQRTLHLPNSHLDFAKFINCTRAFSGTEQLISIQSSCPKAVFVCKNLSSFVVSSERKTSGNPQLTSASLAPTPAASIPLLYAVQQQATYLCFCVIYHLLKLTSCPID
jgi:hypothetical protein